MSCNPITINNPGQGFSTRTNLMRGAILYYTGGYRWKGPNVNVNATPIPAQSGKFCLPSPTNASQQPGIVLELSLSTPAGKKDTYSCSLDAEKSEWVCGPETLDPKRLIPPDIYNPNETFTFSGGENNN